MKQVKLQLQQLHQHRVSPRVLESSYTWPCVSANLPQTQQLCFCSTGPLFSTLIIGIIFLTIFTTKAKDWDTSLLQLILWHDTADGILELFKPQHRIITAATSVSYSGWPPTILRCYVVLYPDTPAIAQPRHHFKYHSSQDMHHWI